MDLETVIIFDVIVETTPENLSNWLLSETYSKPTTGMDAEAIKRLPFPVVSVSDTDTGEQVEFVVMEGKVLSPQPGCPHTRFILNMIKVKENWGPRIINKAVSIEIRELTPQRVQVVGKCLIPFKKPMRIMLENLLRNFLLINNGWTEKVYYHAYRKITRANMEATFMDFNRFETCKFKYPLLSVEFSIDSNDNIEFGLLGHLKHQVEAVMFGRVEITRYEENPCVRGICYLPQYEWASSYFKDLAKHLEIDIWEESESKKKRHKYPPGRPRNKNDDWASEQIYTEKRKPVDVYLEWLERIGERASTLANPHDSFYKAISPKRREKIEKTD